eukprot:SM000004S14894  [mRNA]  locus=s4:73040:73826:- [translate_table: standard]
MLHGDVDDTPYGVILNKQLPFHIRDIDGMDPMIVRTFGSCHVNVGGPLQSDRFLVLHGEEGIQGYEQLLPGIYHGGGAGLGAATLLINDGLAKSASFRFFFGYSGWDVVQLRKEVALGWWHVAACSTDLLLEASVADLWLRVLDLMGGKYAETSQKFREQSAGDGI